jgi:hypothetical protein
MLMLLQLLKGLLTDFLGGHGDKLVLNKSLDKSTAFLNCLLEDLRALIMGCLLLGLMIFSLERSN